MTTPTEARQRRHAARQPHLRREMAELRLHFRHFMRAHQADILALKEAWERISATESAMWMYQATSDVHHDQARRLRCELEAVTAERDALRRDNARLQLQCDNFPEWMNQKNRIINEMSGAVQQLRAERDALRAQLDAMVGEL